MILTQILNYIFVEAINFVTLARRNVDLAMKVHQQYKRGKFLRKS